MRRHHNDSAVTIKLIIEMNNLINSLSASKYILSLQPDIVANPSDSGNNLHKYIIQEITSKAMLASLLMNNKPGVLSIEVVWLLTPKKRPKS